MRNGKRRNFLRQSEPSLGTSCRVERLFTPGGAKIEQSQSRYLRLCDQLGLVYSPLLKMRRAQLQTVLGLGALGTSIPRTWWRPDATPVLSIANWKAHFLACATHAKSSPLPLHFVALE